MVLLQFLQTICSFKASLVIDGSCVFGGVDGVVVELEVAEGGDVVFAQIVSRVVEEVIVVHSPVMR